MVALNPTAEELNKKALAETNITGLGGSDTKEQDFSAYGGLKTFMPDATKMYDAMYGVSEEEQTKQDNIRFGMNMLTFFTQMGAEASKPGATALGAANIAGASTAQQYLKQMETDKAREDKKKTGVINLASKLATFDATKSKANTTKLYTNTTDKPIILATGQIVQPNKNARFSEKGLIAAGDNANLLVPYEKPKDNKFTVKSMGAGDALSYMSEDEAKLYLRNKGLPEDAPTFNRLVKQISTDDTSMHGSPLIISGKPAEINFSSRNGEIFDANISQIQGSEKTDYANYKTKKLQEIAKKDGDYINKITTFLPRIKTAMNVLLDPNVKTGGIEGALLPAKQFLKSMFGFKDEDLKDQEFLRSVSFSLAPLMRPEGSGSTSDMEFKAYQQAILDLGNSKFANYLNLYSLKKMTENSLALNQLETELLVNPKNYSKEYINKKVKEFDTGIFDKFKVLEKNDKGELIDIYETDEEKTIAYKTYWANLKAGSVFRNSDENGQKIVTDAGPYMIKGLK